jgi:calpain family cysteine protease
MKNAQVQVGVGCLVACVLLGLSSPALAESQSYRVEGLHLERGPYVGSLELVQGERGLEIVRQVRYERGGTEELRGLGQRRGAKVRARLAVNVGASGALRGAQGSEVELRMLLEEDGRCRTRCLTKGSYVSRGQGALPGRELGPSEDLAPKGAGKGRKPGYLQSEYKRLRFIGKAFIKGVGDAREIEGNDPEQRALSDCYLVAAMIAIARTDPGVIRKAITSKPGGQYVVRLHGLGSWGRDVDVLVNDRFAVSTGKYKFRAYTASSDRETVGEQKLYELWPSLIEKAFAKHKGGYSEIEGGHSDGPFAWISGKKSSSYWTWHRSAKEVGDVINKANRKGYPICVGTKGNTGALGKKLNLTGNHAYVLWAVKGGRYQLYNPWKSNHPSRALTAAELKKVMTHVYVGEF